MQVTRIGIMLFACAGAVAAMAAPVPRNVPDLLTCEDGTRVRTVADWANRRRWEIAEFFTREVYGRRPVERPDGLRFDRAEPDEVMMAGRAIRKRIRASWTGPRGDWSFVFTAFIPKATVDAGRKAPSFVLICNRPPALNIDPTREKTSYFWPAEEIVDRGYAAIAFWNGDLAPDDRNPVFTNGVYRIYGDRGPETWGALSAWAWGASRVMDWIETEPALDAAHVGVVGHSRGGKTALVAGVTDRRFAMACSNDSGCSGAKLNHVDLPKSESVEVITGRFRHWFSLAYDKWARREREMPYDQHELIALMAPRLVAVASASEDDWAGQLGEFYAARLASPAWELYGKKGLVAPETPPLEGDRPADGVLYQEGSISYHVRPGKHVLGTYDWHRYLDFADRHGWRKCPVHDAGCERTAGGLRLGMAGGTYWRMKSDSVDAILDEIAGLDLHYLSVKDWHLPFDSSDERIAAFRRKCTERRIEPYAVGPVYGDNEDTFRAAFGIARKIGAKLVVGVPFVRRDVEGKSIRFENRDLARKVDALCAEYGLRFAIHNHGPDAPELYPDSKAMADALKGLSPRMGMCLDVGHEFRYGGDPAAAIRTYADRVFDIHMKNVTAPSKDGKAAEFPRGAIDLPAVLSALRDIDFGGVCAIEWERGGKVGEDLPGLAESVGCFRGIAAALEKD